MTEMMKALSVRQPWAWLIVNGYKNIENRKRRTHLRGRILIHASKQFDRAGYECIKHDFPDIPMPPMNLLNFSTGGIVGEVCITDCSRVSDSKWYQGGDLWAYHLTGGKVLPFMPARGNLGFFNVNVAGYL